MGRMVALRSARLETIFGVRLEDLEASHITSLVKNQVSESFDLDFKSELYGGSDKDKRDLAGDVAALANTAGGVLILGVAEDDQARAESAPGVPLSDDEVGRIQKIVASGVAPIPVFDVLSRADASTAGHGFIVIAVPRSPAGPHAVLVNQALRYPKRNGSDTRYLSESEVADAYRSRFAAAGQQVKRATQAEQEANAHLQRPGKCWLMASLVPDLPGELVVDQRAWRTFQDEVIGKSPALLPPGASWTRVTVGRRRLAADGAPGSSPLATWQATELHDDGVGVFSVDMQNYMRQLGGNVPEDTRFMVSDEEIVSSTLSIINFLARHARDRAAAGGNALVRMALLPDVPVLLGQTRSFGGRLGTQEITDFGEPVERLFSLDDLADEGPALVSAAYVLATDLFQAFGFSEAHQLTRDGQIRIRYWSAPLQPAVKDWAGRAGVELTDEAFS